MRDLIAKAVGVLTFVVVVALSLYFAVRQNPGGAAPNVSVMTAAPEPNRVTTPTLPAPETAGATGPVSATVERGRDVYHRQGCTSCHSIGGVGSPRCPLDGVGARRPPAELREWVLAAGAAATQIPGAVVRRKRRYQELPAADLDALVAYLVTLRSAG